MTRSSFSADDVQFLGLHDDLGHVLSAAGTMNNG